MSRSLHPRAFSLLTLAIALSSCGSGSATGAGQAARPTASARARPGALAYSTAANDVVQRQPPSSSCHARGTGPLSRPDPACTPGALDPAVTQATIATTICARGWTATVRPPEAVTEREKAASLAAYGDTGAIGDYEYDHLVPLELGGATNDPRNLWPQPGASPNPKDAVEDRLRQQVCGGQLSLAAAQREIATAWTALAHASRAAPTRAIPAPPAAGAHCTITAAYNPRYDDYDVDVRSDQPEASVTVSDDAGHVKSWHTGASGGADVYFRAGGQAPGRHITARVGAASCATTL